MVRRQHLCIAQHQQSSRERTSMFSSLETFTSTFLHAVLPFSCFAPTFHRVRSAKQHHLVAHLPQRDFYWIKFFITFYREKEKRAKALTLCLCKNLGELSAKLADLRWKIIRIRSTQVQIKGKNLTNTSKVYPQRHFTRMHRENWVEIAVFCYR
jgi:hypothetical protein